VIGNINTNPYRANKRCRARLVQVFRATGNTAYLEGGGTLERAQTISSASSCRYAINDDEPVNVELHLHQQLFAEGV
jgi:hypothetical protein